MAAEINDETSNLLALGRFVRFLGQKLLGNRDEDNTIVRITDAKGVRQTATRSPVSGSSGVRKEKEAIGKSTVNGRNRRKRTRLDGKYNRHGNRLAGPKAEPIQQMGHNKRKNNAKIHRVYTGLRARADSVGSKGGEKSQETDSRRARTDYSPKLNGSSHSDTRLANDTSELPLDRALMVFRAIRVDPNSTPSSYSESGSDAETQQPIKQSSISFILNKAASPIEYYKEDLPNDHGPHLPSRAPQTPPSSSASRELRSATENSGLGQDPVHTPLTRHIHSGLPTTKRLSRTPSYRIPRDITLTNLNPSNATTSAVPVTPSPRTISDEPKVESSSYKRPGSRLMSEILAERYQNSGMNFKGDYLSPLRQHYNH